MKHQWQHQVLTPEEAENNPWILFGEMPRGEDGGYDGPTIDAWDNDDPNGGHYGPLCVVCGYGFCHTCEWDQWTQVALGTEKLQCQGSRLATYEKRRMDQSS